MKTMKRLAIIGSGDLGQQMAYHAFSDNHYQPVGFFDDYQLVGTVKYGYPVLGKLNEIKFFFDQISVPVQEWASVFGQHQDLAENVWICLTWTQRHCLKQGFLAKRLLMYLNEASTP